LAERMIAMAITRLIAHPIPTSMQNYTLRLH
jgi:hypothetical protein